LSSTQLKTPSPLCRLTAQRWKEEPSDSTCLHPDRLEAVEEVDVEVDSETEVDVEVDSEEAEVVDSEIEVDVEVVSVEDVVEFP